MSHTDQELKWFRATIKGTSLCLLNYVTEVFMPTIGCEADWLQYSVLIGRFKSCSQTQK